MITSARYKSLKNKLALWEATLATLYPKQFGPKGRGGSYDPKAVLSASGLRAVPTNEDRADVELYEFEHAPGAPEAIHGYVGNDGHTLQNFTGRPLPGVSSLRVTHTEKLRNNPYSSTRHSYEATFRGHRYSGRGYGSGMNLTLKKRQA